MKKHLCDRDTDILHRDIKVHVVSNETTRCCLWGSWKKKTTTSSPRELFLTSAWYDVSWTSLDMALLVRMSLFGKSAQIYLNLRSYGSSYWIAYWIKRRFQLQTTFYLYSFKNNDNALVSKIQCGYQVLTWSYITYFIELNNYLPLHLVRSTKSWQFLETI